ncbi:hypothetical protein GGI1_14803 [Acidithiobacillus sp. GGI-221]|nr:hypothetical protein GGI1_14803 [Acidithiobacillus sp. GGI-221]
MDGIHAVGNVLSTLKTDFLLDSQFIEVVRKRYDLDDGGIGRQGGRHGLGADAGSFQNGAQCMPDCIRVQDVAIIDGAWRKRFGVGVFDANFPAGLRYLHEFYRVRTDIQAEQRRTW